MLLAKDWSHAAGERQAAVTLLVEFSSSRPT
jgi:hypothetical protein